MESFGNTTAGGCCVTPYAEAERPPEIFEKPIIVYPYVDPGVPFSELEPAQITFYLHVSNKTGRPKTRLLSGGAAKPTCGANCSGCYFQTLPPYALDPKLALRVAGDFRTQGYDVGVVTADSFSDLALYDLAEAGSAFRYDTVTTQNGNAWTSGNLLAGRRADQRLDRGWELGYGVVTISLYNMVSPHPMKGTPSNRAIEKAIGNIKAWNLKRFPEGGGYKIITTQLINRQNCNIDTMRAVAQWCLLNGVSICRFNAFANFMKESGMSEFELRREDIERFWALLAQLQDEFMNTDLQFAVSEDMSSNGIEACIPYFSKDSNWERFDPEQPYWCRAGYRLFSINGVQNGTRQKLQITGCVDNWSKAPMGEVVMDESSGLYRPNFNLVKIESLRAAVLDGTLSTCWGGVGQAQSESDQRGMIPDPQAERKFFEENF